jgi:4-amino-4-deoxy-L-arabinose transferase-like glycosyltransferase
VTKHQRTINYAPLVLALAAVLIVRLVTLSFPDLMDTTEGRYATVAKLMLERDDWVTPWLIYKGVAEPYLGKPPLHFWLIDFSYLTFGINSFAARFPGVVTGAATCALVALFGRLFIGTAAGLVAALVLSTCTLLYFLAGGTVLDVTLTFGITLALLSFLAADRSRWYGYLCFVGLGLGVLVKGPLAVVLAAITIVPWIALRWFLTGTLPEQLRRLPIVSGASLFILIAVPWYLWAEIRNPGFLDYFIMVENLGRFSDPHYADKYGTGHRQPLGTVWLMMIPAIFPWIIITVAMAGNFFKRLRSGALREWSNDPLLSFFALWTLTTPALLTFATQYTGTYLVPLLPGFALLAALLWERWDCKAEEEKQFELRLCRGLIYFLSLVVVVGSWISLSFEGTLTNAIISFCIGLVMLALACINLKTARDSVLLVSCIGIYTAVAFGLSSLCFDNHLSNSRSTRRVLELAASLHDTNKPLTVAFRGDLPFSASFYKDLVTANTIQVVGVHDEELSSTTADFIAARKSGIDVVTTARPNGVIVGKIGKWSLLDNRQQH